MKLRVTDWKHAWFESQISDRFFHEMSRLEKGTVQGLESTGQWMEQIMIEVGALAQAMIRLEQEGAPEPQIRQACDKALRLAALGLHLITALDGADREYLRSSSAVRDGRPDWAVPRGGPAPPEPRPEPQAPAPEPRPAGPRTHATTAELLARNAALRPPPGVQTGGAEDAGREAARNALDPADAEAVERRAAEASAEGTPGPMFTSLLQVSGRNAPRSESHMRQTILSLAQQGLSRAEIETVTGEPRHIVEAVLNHARGQRQAAAQPG